MVFIYNEQEKKNVISYLYGNLCFLSEKVSNVT